MSEQSPPRTDLGQRFFLLGVFAILVVEAILTVVNFAQWFEWSSLALGVVAGILILYLGNWLYTGDKTALTVMRIWIVLQLVLVLVAVLVTLAGAPADSTLPRHLGINMMWQGWLKLAAYGTFAGMLFLPGVMLDFLAEQRGEVPASAPVAVKEEAPAMGPPVDLTAEHTQALTGLGNAMKKVSGVLLMVGAFQILTGLLALGQAPTKGGLSLVEGAALAALGAVLLAPAGAVLGLVGATPRHMGLVVNLLNRLLVTYKVYLVIVLVLTIVAVCRVVLHVL
jgi:hypothetical protein